MYTVRDKFIAGLRNVCMLGPFYVTEGRDGLKIPKEKHDVTFEHVPFK